MKNQIVKIALTSDITLTIKSIENNHRFDAMTCDACSNKAEFISIFDNKKEECLDQFETMLFCKKCNASNIAELIRQAVNDEL
jgi:hypothetical protein